MKPPPPMPEDCGSITFNAKATATAASIALPPWRRISAPAFAARGSLVVTTPPRTPGTPSARLLWAQETLDCASQTVPSATSASPAASVRPRPRLVETSLWFDMKCYFPKWFLPSTERDSTIEYRSETWPFIPVWRYGGEGQALSASPKALRPNSPPRSHRGGRGRRPSRCGSGKRPRRSFAQASRSPPASGPAPPASPCSSRSRSRRNRPGRPSSR